MNVRPCVLCADDVIAQNEVLCDACIAKEDAADAYDYRHIVKTLPILMLHGSWMHSSRPVVRQHGVPVAVSPERAAADMKANQELQEFLHGLRALSEETQREWADATGISEPRP